MALPDLTTLTDDEIDTLAARMETERQRRYTLANAPALIATQQEAYVRALGRENGDEWAQPEGAHDAYALDAVVTHGGKQWRSLIANNVWEPGVSGWRELTEPETTPPDWVQPTGAHDAYPKGARVMFDAATYESLVDGNVWSPIAYPAGWLAV